MALRLLVTLLLGACAAPSPPPPATPPSAEIPAAPPELAPVQDAGGADAASDAEAETAPVVRASFALRVDLPPCKFLFHAGVGSQSEVGRYLMAVSRIEVEASESCTAHVVFDESTEAKSDPDSYQGPLEGGLLPNEGKLEAARADSEGPEPVFVDANFDGYLDLTVGEMSGAYNRSSRFWLFDPAQKRFVPSKELEELLMPRFDQKRKRVEAGGRAGGPVYVGSEHEWVNGKLETVWSETTTLGETPQGKPLPKGFTSWRVRYERRGGSMKKVIDGPAR
ncbi:MAG: hypothetical protein KJ015_07925 [Myxococcales bacterium]|nr:hypothetical protein [Myxococcales bacterium]